MLWSYSIAPILVCAAIQPEEAILFVIRVAAFVFSVVLHEVAHGYAAYRLGDPTAHMSKRLTLNPLAHIDLFGSIILPLILMFTSPVVLGWAKPVPFNPMYFRNPRKGIMIVGAAGPLANFAVAVVSGLLFQVVTPFAPLAGWFLVYLCITNVVLGVFNLIPIPPLDGSRVMIGILPPRLLQGYLQLERYGFIIVFILLLPKVGVMDFLITPVVNLMLGLFLGVH